MADKKKAEVEDKRALVSYKLGITKSMGNFESLRLDIGVSLPCKENEVGRTYQKAKKQVGKWMDKELSKYAVLGE